MGLGLGLGLGFGVAVVLAELLPPVGHRAPRARLVVLNAQAGNGGGGGGGGGGGERGAPRWTMCAARRRLSHPREEPAWLGAGFGFGLGLA